MNQNEGTHRDCPLEFSVDTRFRCTVGGDRGSGSFFEDVFGDGSGGHRGGPSGVESEMGDQLAQFTFSDAIFKCTAEMEFELIGTLHRDQGSAGDEAAIAFG